MRVETRYEYIAFDGKSFSNREDCQRHELILGLSDEILSELDVTAATAIAAAAIAIGWIKSKADANQFFDQD